MAVNRAVSSHAHPEPADSRNFRPGRKTHEALAAAGWPMEGGGPADDGSIGFDVSLHGPRRPHIDEHGDVRYVPVEDNNLIASGIGYVRDL